MFGHLGTTFSLILICSKKDKQSLQNFQLQKGLPHFKIFKGSSSKQIEQVIFNFYFSVMTCSIF